jgi:hypothetical protein
MRFSIGPDRQTDQPLCNINVPAGRPAVTPRISRFNGPPFDEPASAIGRQLTAGRAASRHEY